MSLENFYIILEKLRKIWKILLKKKPRKNLENPQISQYPLSYLKLSNEVRFRGKVRLFWNEMEEKGWFGEPSLKKKLYLIFKETKKNKEFIVVIYLT